MSKLPFSAAATDAQLSCPRDKITMREEVVGQAHLDVCVKCGGQFFDAGEMFAACGVKADPSYWDRPETGGTVKASPIACARCGSHMLGQDVSYEGVHVEIDRCGSCGGIWLDKGEVQTLMKISEKLQPLIDAERAKAQKDLAAMGDVSFASPGLIARFLGLFKKKGGDA
jgi:Zn-finger nucleic acid-binding protein